MPGDIPHISVAIIPTTSQVAAPAAPARALFPCATASAAPPTRAALRLTYLLHQCRNQLTALHNNEQYPPIFKAFTTSTDENKKWPPIK